MIPTNPLGAPDMDQVRAILAENGNPTAIGYTIVWDRSTNPGTVKGYVLITTDGEFEIAVTGPHAGCVVRASAYYALPA